MAVNLSTTRIDTPALAPSGPVCSITFTDTTLVGATIGAVYSDSVIAETRIGTLASSAPITYAITSGALPSGLTLNSSSGLVSGTPISLATVGSYTAGVTASSPSYPSQSISYTFQLAAAASSTDKTLSFNDATLVGATIGTVYSDSVTAVAKTGTTTDNGVVITYALSSGSLPSGLVLSSSTGLISGTPSTSAPTGAYPVTFLASTPSTGYPPQSLSYTFQLAAASIERTIVFTDTTLYDATVGTFYADYIIAATKIGNNLSSAAVTYFVDPSSLPIGLTLNPLNGLVSGIPSPSTRTGTYYGLISALATEYPTKSQYFAFQLNAAVSTDKTITFTDTTLNDATIGTFYSDYVIAASKIGSGFNGAPITYSVEAGTPLPIGLTLNPLTGLISGTPISSARTGTYTSIIWASSPGYPAQSLNYTFQTYASLTKSSNPSTPLQASFGTPVNTLMMTALFANNSSALTSKNRSAIKTMATKLKTLNVATLTVAGYASANGKSGHLKLSIARAKAVAAVLASSGVKTKISIKGLGIFASTGTQSALALSRKAEIWVLQNS
jgi:outer membrane protein OmpA-like peptidoglycan-associated protein